MDTFNSSEPLTNSDETSHLRWYVNSRNSLFYRSIAGKNRWQVVAHVRAHFLMLSGFDVCATISALKRLW
jgi:hypothetical protein